jgi:hypothetical protein
MNHRIALVLGLVTAVVLASESAHAEDASGAASQDGKHLHDGFYLRMALGGGAFASRDAVSEGPSASSQPTYSGGGGALEISIGGTAHRGVVFAGSILLQSAVLGTMRDSAGTQSVTHRHDFAMFGPTLDWFPRPAEGFHVLATVGGVVMGDYRDDAIRKTWASRGGAGLSVGVGYDAWISSSWSLGFLLRATGASLASTEHAVDDRGVTTSEIDTQRSVAAMSLTFTALYH